MAGLTEPPAMDLQDALLQQLPHTLSRTAYPSLGTHYEGKVRDTYARGDTLVLVVTDRLSAFDRVLTTLPFKGEVLNRLSAFWFARTAHVVKNHFLDMPDPNVTVARRCMPIPIEVVVRGHLTGSLWRDVQGGRENPYGVAIDPDLPRFAAFPSPIVTPATKEAVGKHDEPISEAALLARGLVEPKVWAQIREVALALFAEGQSWATSRGLVLVDTKYEFGLVGDTLYLIDEIHTPDSSRYWVRQDLEARLAAGEEPQMLDKENLRRWLINERGFMGNGELPTIPDDFRVELAGKYLAAYEAITGVILPLEIGPVAERLTKNLQVAGLL